MRPIKITLQGDYFDCQLYRGRLYLWTFSGKLQIIDWNSLMYSVAEDSSEEFVISCCFTDGSFLYKNDINKLFQDQDFKSLLDTKFLKIQNRNIVLTNKQIHEHIIGEQDSPTGDLPIDTEIYNNNLFVATDDGLFRSTAHRPKSGKYLVSSKPEKFWDCRLLSLKANKYPQMALSAGEEGLYELNMAESKYEKLKRVESYQPIFKVSEKHSSFGNYSTLSIYNTSLVESSFLAMFNWSRTNDRYLGDTPVREYEGIVEEDKIFQSKHSKKFVSWGIDDKIYRATDGGFEIVKFNNYAKEEKGEHKFTTLRNVNLHPWKGDVINGGTTFFGNIIECENALVVLMSNKKSMTIRGPITRWRTYPRSHNYENQLHVIKDNSLEIYGYFHDYFINNRDKEIGIEFKNFRGRFGF